MLSRSTTLPAKPHAKSSSPQSLALLAFCLIGGFSLIGLWSSRHGVTQDKRSQCQSNLRHLALAFAQYCADNDGMFPSGTMQIGPHSRHTAGLGWAGQILPDVGSDAVFHCPADLEPDANKTGENVSYGYNVNLPGNHVRISNLSAPSHTVLVFEVAGVWIKLDTPGEGSGDETPRSAAGDGTPIYLNDGVMPRTVLYATGGGGGRPYFCPPPFCAWPPTRHGVDAAGTDGANYLLADGHVRWLGPDQVATGGTALTPTAQESGATYGRAAGTANRDFQATYSPR